MSDGLLLASRVIAIVGTGSDDDRAIAVACAEAGADVALGTEVDDRGQDYGMNSIANEIWAIGREQFVLVLSGSDDLARLVAEAKARLGRCDAIVARTSAPSVDGVPVVARGKDPSSILESVVDTLEKRAASRAAEA
jgi:NAD(P)-dependent dehydrogenase (short-subunit alcohol dehydrogenase family)